MAGKSFNTRSSFLSGMVIFWCLLICVYLFYFSCVNRERYIRSRDGLAKRIGVIHALRGSILDKNGVPLAWSETLFDLVIATPPKNKLVANQLYLDVVDALGLGVNDSSVWKGGGVVYPGLKIKMMPKVKELCQAYSHYLVVKRRIVRKYYDNQSLKTVLGAITSEKNGMVGITGLEFIFDETLRGIHGAYSIMIDRSGQWLPGEWGELNKPIRGKDVTVALAVGEFM